MATCVECVIRTFKYRNKAQTAITGAFHHSDWIPVEIAQAPAFTLLSRKHRRRRTERKQKRGCRAEGHQRAKAAHRERTEAHLSNRDPARMRQGIQHITNYIGNQQPPPDNNIHLAEELNHFSASFENVWSDNEATPPLDAADYSPQCVLSPMLYSLYTYDCISTNHT